MTEIRSLDDELRNAPSLARFRACDSGTHKLSSSPKLPLMFASGYVNTAHVSYFLNGCLSMEICADALVNIKFHPCESKTT